MERTTLSRLLTEGFHGSAITGLSSDSRACAPGHLFVAKRGAVHCIEAALKAGAIAVLTDTYDPACPATQLITPNVPAVEAQLASVFYGHPEKQLFLVGITGTNGKTTTAYLARHLLGGGGLIGTVEWCIGSQVLPSTHTTPDTLQNYELFARMVKAGCASCVMEVSSHALHQQRVHSIPFNVAVFTQLTQDHLDYHQTMNAYAEAKESLFTSLAPTSVAVINADCPYGAQMVRHCKASTIFYGIDFPCDMKASSIRLSAQGTTFTLSYQGVQCAVTTPLIGRYNVSNTLAALCVGVAKGLPLELLIEKLRHFENVPGRLERIPNTKGLNIYVDYAHTDDALRNVLLTLKEMRPRRLIALFGCGGNRDASKRPKMGAVAEALCDQLFITSDNPRQEAPSAIIEQILQGLIHPERAHVIEDRKRAIESAVESITADDILLIAGKGHERTQTCGAHILPFDDRAVVRSFVSSDI